MPIGLESAALGAVAGGTNLQSPASFALGYGCVFLPRVARSQYLQ
eukprot:COSAG05_NODE_17013_length_333_cov_1.303419_1_plen_44_part_10